MTLLQGKKILLGITGSIAAYKAAYLCRLFVKNGAQVRVLMTRDACSFIGPITLSTLSGHPVVTDFTDDANSWNNHVEYGLWADMFVIAPVTANTIAKMAAGICDNFLLACYLSARKTVVIAPAMDLDMWNHPATLANLKKLAGYGNQIVKPEFGSLASGLTGMGRMAEPETIYQFCLNLLNPQSKLAGKNILITAGPTQEAIDPVRFISNHSSGKMGIEIARAAASLGANVTLILGPTTEAVLPEGVEIIPVISAAEMHHQCLQRFEKAEVTIMAAAVSDYSPKEIAPEKIKKGNDQLQLELVKTPDILADLGKIKRKNQVLAGFALETNDELENARKKLHTKNLDLVVLNSLKDEGAGFGHSTNKITILQKNGEIHTFDLKPKSEVAIDILSHIEAIF